MAKPNQTIIQNVNLPDGPAEIVRLAGVGPLSNAHRALFAAIRRPAPVRTLVAGPGTTPTALWAARAGAALYHLADSIAEAQSLDETLRLHRLPSATDIRYDAEAPLECDLALVHLPRGRTRQQEILHCTAYHLRPGAKLIFVAAKNEGIRTAVKDVVALLGRAGVVARKGGYHAALAYRPSKPITPPRLAFQETTVILDRTPARLVSCAGAFAHEQLDGGAAALIQGMQIVPGAVALDLGCGTGLVALAAARRGAEVVATDVSYRAVASARRTLAANGYEAIPVFHAHGASGIEDGTQGIVVTNPPFHRGHDVDYEVARFFVSEAARVLKPNGHLFLVANAFLDYGAWLAQHFAVTDIAWEDRRYRVWHAIQHPQGSQG